MPKIYFIDAHCGSGKTEAALKHVKLREKFREKFLIIQPTTDLIDATAERLRNMSYDGSIETITYKTHNGHVTKAIHNFLNDTARFEWGVLFITFESWRRVDRRNMKDWHVIVDEAPTVFDVSSIGSKAFHHILTEHIDLIDLDDRDYSQVIIKNGSKNHLGRLLKDSRTDPGLAMFTKTIDYLLSGFQTKVCPIAYQRLLDRENVTVHFYHVARPRVLSGFRSVTIMSANFTETMFYKIWCTFGVRFVQRQGFRHNPLSPTHPKEIGEALNIYYLTEDWSKYRKMSTDHREVYESEFKRAVVDLFAGEPFVYTLNRFDDPRLFEGFSGARYVPPYPHGLNSYRDYHNIAIYAHFNLSNDRVRFLRKEFGVSSDEVWDLINRQNYYQIVSRISLREKAYPFFDVHPKKVIAMDRDMAFYLQTKFPGSRVHKFQSDLIDSLPEKKRGRKPIRGTATSNAERIRNHRAKKQSADLARKLKLLGAMPNIEKSSEMRNENTLIDKIQYISKDDLEEVWSCSMIGSIYSKFVESGTLQGMDEFVAFMEQQSHRVLSDKEKENILINTTKFHERDGVLRRRLDDVVVSFALWLDNDDKDTRTAMEFADLVSSTELLVYSSFRSSLEVPRWRAVIPFSRPVTQKEYNQIAKDIHAIGKEHGFLFDACKKQPNDFMYLPCVGQNPDAFLFEHMAGTNRRPLDVDVWMNPAVTDGEGDVGPVTLHSSSQPPQSEGKLLYASNPNVLGRSKEENEVELKSVGVIPKKINDSIKSFKNVEYL